MDLYIIIIILLNNFGYGGRERYYCVCALSIPLTLRRSGSDPLGWDDNLTGPVGDQTQD